MGVQEEGIGVEEEFVFILMLSKKSVFLPEDRTN